MHAATLEPCLTVRLPSPSDGVVEAQTADGRVFRHGPGAPPERLRADKIWQKIVEGWHDRRTLLTAAGAELGEWLYGREAAAYLRELLDGFNESTPVRR